MRTALTVAIGLGQIGEFSFILSELGRQHGLLDATEHNLLVACAIVSITLNPLLFKLIPSIESALRKQKALWRYLDRGRRDEGRMTPHAAELVDGENKPIAVVLGFGPVGRSVDAILRERGVETIVVDMNIDTINALQREGRGRHLRRRLQHRSARPGGREGDAPDHHPAARRNRGPLIAAAKLINPDLKVFVRARYLGEADELRQVGADDVAYEEAEVGIALARLLLADRGADRETISNEIGRLRTTLRPA